MNKYIVNELFVGDGSLIIQEHLLHILKEIENEMITNLSIKSSTYNYEYDLFDTKLKTLFSLEDIQELINQEFKLSYSYTMIKEESVLNVYEINDYLSTKIKGFKYKLSLVSDIEDSLNELYIYDDMHHGECEYTKILALDHGTWHMLDEIFAYEANERVKDNQKIIDLIEELAPYVRIDVTNYYDSEMFDVFGDKALEYQDLIKMFDILAKILHLMFKDSEYEYIDFVYANLECDDFELLRVTFNFKDCNYMIEKSV